MIAESFGWVGFAADIYGLDYHDGVPDFAIRREQATLYRSNNTLFVGRMQAAVDLMKAHSAVDPDNIAIIGCKSKMLPSVWVRVFLKLSLPIFVRFRLLWWYWYLDIFLLGRHWN
jgi:hypothetical protein